MKKTYLIGRLIGEDAYSFAPLLMEIEVLKSNINVVMPYYYFNGNGFKNKIENLVISNVKKFGKMIPFKIKKVLKRFPKNADYMSLKKLEEFVDNNESTAKLLNYRTPIKQDLALEGDNIYLYPETLLSDKIFTIDESSNEKKESINDYINRRFLHTCDFSSINSYFSENLKDYLNKSTFEDIFLIYNPETVETHKNENIDYEYEVNTTTRYDLKMLYIYSITNNADTKNQLAALFIKPTISDLEKYTRLIKKDNNTLLFNSTRLFFNINKLNDPLPFISLKSCLSQYRPEFNLMDDIENIVQRKKYFIGSVYDINAIPANFVRDTVLIQNLSTGKIETLKNYLKEKEKK